MWLTRISIRNPYFAAVLMIALVVLGLLGWQKLPVEAMPEVRAPLSFIDTSYPGASPEVVETEVSRPLEEVLNTISGIKEIRSYSMEGRSTVIVTFQFSVDPDKAQQQVREKVSSVQGSFRREVGVPFISAADNSDEDALVIAVLSDAKSMRATTSWVNQVLKKRLQMVQGVSQVSISGGDQREVRVRVDPVRLEASGLSVPEIVSALKAANRDFPAGSVSTASQEWSVRVAGKLRSVDDFANLAVGYRNGAPIRLSDVAEVDDAAADATTYALIDGKPGLSVSIKSARDANVVDVVAAVKETMDDLSRSRPAGISTQYMFNQADYVKRSLDTVQSTLIEGVALTVAIVFLFLGSWRSTVITGLTLPVSLIGTLFALHALGFTLNIMTLLALCLSIGLLIDDAIVVRENIVRHAGLGKGHYQAAMEGTQEIGLAVLATTMTVVAVFLPVGFMDGMIGKYFHQFGITVTVAVLISMLVSFTLDPMLSSIWHDPHHHGDKHRGPLGRMLDWFESSLDRLSERYGVAIRWALRRRKTVLALAFAITVSSVLLAGMVGGEMIPEADEGKFSLSFETEPGATLDYTLQKGKELQQALSALPEIKSVNMTVGPGSDFVAGRNSGNITVDVGNIKTRKRSLNAIIEDARHKVMPVAGVSIKSFGNDQGNGKPIRIGLRGSDFNQLSRAAMMVKERLQSIKGVRDIETSADSGDPSLNLELKRDAAANLGVDLERVGSTLSVLFGGNAATTWEAPDGESYDVMLQLPKDARRQELLDELKVAGVPAADGSANMIPLSALVSEKTGLSPRVIKRTNMMRELMVMAAVQGKDTHAVTKEAEQAVHQLQLPPGVEVIERGMLKDMNEMMVSAITALLLGVAFIYMILAAQFRSFTLPVSIMMALPLSFVGVFISLALWGSTINMYSVIGIVMLMGLSAKNGILLIDFVNQARQEGMERTEAIVKAGMVRLRPIMMTSLAMIFGMLPLALSHAEGSEGTRTMAHAIIGGLVTSTLLTLLVVPVVYTYLDGLRARIRRLLRGKAEPVKLDPALGK
ncbi:efflux RND transporter permease subunit [Chromobacterium sp. IIBBL 290-4]|uniref:efflux RND transporter permease subunit n=1 Tax=Chromobacterium sp. IIBBL 290-4 TaxID=2953890 RepID=UPI0020B88BA0|nr:efflux RND transporter permease subunit [Chromobacterium sp. IIBBL 290-4]UTH73092.1 efflux RND transporter permease subunit [Chromobacterium sp. IIBBL 290-4]